MTNNYRKSSLAALLFVVLALIFVVNANWENRTYQNDVAYSSKGGIETDTGPAEVEVWNGSKRGQEINNGIGNIIGYSPREIEVRNDFLGANDLKLFVDSYKEHAVEGDPSAQFYLAMSLAECTRFALFYITRNFESVDDWMYYYNTDTDETKESVAKSYDRCKGFLSKDEQKYEFYFGNGEADQSWLIQAAASGHPEAQLIDASRLRSTGKEADKELAVQYMEQAALSRHPEALYRIGMRYRGRGSTNRDPVRYVAWSILACEYGKDCAANSEWVRFLCEEPLGCVAGEDVKTLLGAQEGQHALVEAQVLANSLRTSLNAGNLEELDLPVF